MLFIKPSSIFQKIYDYSTQILIVLVFFLVLFTILGNPIKNKVLHIVHEPSLPSVTINSFSSKSIEMKNSTQELLLPYEFKAEDLIADGRTTKENVEEIRTWISNLNNKYVPTSLQDEVIVIFLISCTNDVELTKKTILSYYQLKFEGPEIYDNRDLNEKDLQKALNTVHMSSIPVRTDENVVYHYFNLNDTYYRNFDLVTIMKISYMLMDVSQEKNPPNGLIVVIDMKGCGVMHLTRLQLKAVKKYLTFLQEGFPMKLQYIHIINSVYIIDKIMAIVKMFVKGELMSMFHIHPTYSDPEKLFEIIPKKYLPMEYGGDLPSEKELHEKTLEQFKKMQEFWNIEEKIRKMAYSD